MTSKGTKQFSLSALFVAFIVSFLISSGTSVEASVDGEAFWGSFGEGAGRIECVVFKSENESQLIGYDEETETGFFSTSVSWEESSDFSFEGVTIKDESTVASAGRGLVGTVLSANETQSVLLEGSIGDEELTFQAFDSGAAIYHQFELIGQERSTVKVVVGDNGLVYALFANAEGIAYGGEIEFEDESSEAEFVTPEGDAFIFDLDRLSGSFELANGSTGELTDIAFKEIAKGSETWVEQVWLSESKLAERGSSAVHFIIEGDGTASVSVDALVSVVEASPEWLLASEAAIGLYRMDAEGEYELLFESSNLHRVKMSAYSLLDLEGLLSCEIGEGTYLVQISGIFEARSVNEIVVSFDEESQQEGLRLINMSTLYIAGQVEGERSFGFSLGGEGVSKAVVRNVGPSLSEFDVPSYTLDPRMAIARNSMKSWKNDDWWQASSPSQLSDTMRSLGAFSLEEKSKDAAAKLTIEAGDYEVSPQGSQKDSAFELIEVYFEEQS